MKRKEFTIILPNVFSQKRKIYLVILRNIAKHFNTTDLRTQLDCSSNLAVFTSVSEVAENFFVLFFFFLFCTMLLVKCMGVLGCVFL